MMIEARKPPLSQIPTGTWTLTETHLFGVRLLSQSNTSETDRVPPSAPGTAVWQFNDGKVSTRTSQGQNPQTPPPPPSETGQCDPRQDVALPVCGSGQLPPPPVTSTPPLVTSTPPLVASTPPLVASTPPPSPDSSPTFSLFISLQLHLT